MSVSSRWAEVSLPAVDAGVTGALAISQAASASEIVLEAIEYVASAVLGFFGRAGAGNAGIGARNGAERGHCAGIGPPSIHVRTDWSAHAGRVGRDRAVAHAGDDQQLAVREAGDDGARRLRSACACRSRR